MTIAEIIDIQDEIIRLQSKLIKAMALLLRQNETFESAENEIREIKRKLGEPNGL